MTRVLHLLPQGDVVGGTERSVLDLLASERLAGVEQRVAFTQPVRGGAFPAEALLSRTPWGAVAAARRWRPDVLHGWLLRGNAFAVGLKPAVPAARVVTSERNVGHALNPPKRALERIASRFEDVATANSSAVRDAARRRIPGRRIEVIPPGVAPLPVPQAVSRCDALMVGRLHPVKDHATALRAWRAVVARRPGSTLAIVGDGPERERLEALARSLGIEAGVVFAGEAGPARHLHGARVFLLSSRAEGFSRALIEALAVGLPAVSTAVGGVDELPTGAVARVAVGDAEAMAAALLALLEDEAAHAGASQAALTAARRYSPDACHDAYAALYERLVATGSPS